jgi:hypothetical protein
VVWPQQRPTPPRARPGATAGKSAAEWYIQSTDKVVGLTDFQKKAIAGLFAERDRQIKDFQTRNADKLKAVSAAMVAAYKRGDKEAIAKTHKAQQEAYAPLGAIGHRYQAYLLSVLRSDQLTKLREHEVATMLKGTVDPVRLSDEQRKRITAAYAQWRSKGQFDTWSKFPDLLQEVLTPEQVKAIAKHRAMSYLRAVTGPKQLGPAQWKQAAAACDELLAEQLPKAGWDLAFQNKFIQKVKGMLVKK